jgi:hypothetical protein
MNSNRFLRLEWARRHRVPEVALVLVLLGAAAAIGLRGSMGRTRPGEQAPAAQSAITRLPRVMLWAWERPEDMRFLDTREAGVAFLAGTIEIGSSGSTGHAGGARGVELQPRRQPLRVPPGTALMAVVRIETPNDLWHRPPGWRGSAAAATATSLYSKAQRNRVADMIAAVARLHGVRAVQVDYDATKSEQPFYRRLLVAVRRRLPPGMPLSMTALASWCIGDAWLNSLPPGTIDEAVPMLFRMGPDGSAVEAFVKSDRAFRARACRASVGVSTDEAFSRQLLAGGLSRQGARERSRRIYVFSTRAWTKVSVKQIVAEVDKWDAVSLPSR